MRCTSMFWPSSTLLLFLSTDAFFVRTYCANKKDESVHFGMVNKDLYLFINYNQKHFGRRPGKIARLNEQPEGIRKAILNHNA